MASLQKITYTYWVDAEGRRVKKGVPGATKKTEQSTKWYACWSEGGKQHHVPLATDKDASQAMMTDLMRKKDRTTARLIDPHQAHLDRDVAGHKDDYIASITASGKVKGGKYLSEKKRILDTIFRVAKIKTLGDLTGTAIDAYMDALDTSAGTRRVHHTAIHAFADWLVQKKRLPADPLVSVARPQGGKAVRKRRAMTPDELQRLITSARERPLQDALYKPRGKGSRGKRSLTPCRLTPATRDRFAAIGRERALLYKAAVYTGLRKGELGSVKVKFLNLDRKPYPSVELPGEFTKNGEEARLLLVPSLAEDLRRWISDTGRGPDDTLFDVPAKVMPGMLLDLKRAGIEYRDEKGRHADFHSLRKSVNTMLGIAGVPVRLRQLFMRHSDIRLTMQTYDDSALHDMEEVMKALESMKLE